MTNKVYKIEEIKLIRNSESIWSLSDTPTTENTLFCVLSDDKLGYIHNTNNLIENIKNELKLLNHHFTKLEKSIKKDPYNILGKPADFNGSLHYISQKTRDLTATSLSHLNLANYISSFFFSEYTLIQVNGIIYKTSRDLQSSYSRIKLEPL